MLIIARTVLFFTVPASRYTMMLYLRHRNAKLNARLARTIAAQNRRRVK